MHIFLTENMKYELRNVRKLNEAGGTFGGMAFIGVDGIFSMIASILIATKIHKADYFTA